MSGKQLSEIGRSNVDSRNELNHNGITPTQQMIASCSGALITSLFVTPLDVVKIRLQSQIKPFNKGSCFIYCNGLMDHLCICANGNDTTIDNRPWYRRPSPPTRLTGTIDAFIKIVRYEGVASLWSGLPPTLIMAVPATVIYFTTYDRLKYLMGYSETNRRTLHIPLLAGSLARVFAATAITPLELVRTKMQSQLMSYSQVGQAVRVTIQQEGLYSLMKGLAPTLARDVPFSALYWFGYESLKSYHMEKSGATKLNFVQSFSSGAAAGMVAAVVTTPFDVVKTHRQIELGEAKPSKNTTSMYKIMKKLFRQNGVKTLFTGVIPRTIKVAPACAIMISAYEYGKNFFRTHNEVLATSQ